MEHEQELMHALEQFLETLCGQPLRDLNFHETKSLLMEKYKNSAEWPLIEHALGALRELEDRQLLRSSFRIASAGGCIHQRRVSYGCHPPNDHRICVDRV